MFHQVDLDAQVVCGYCVVNSLNRKRGDNSVAPLLFVESYYDAAELASNTDHTMVSRVRAPMMPMAHHRHVLRNILVMLFICLILLS